MATKKKKKSPSSPSSKGNLEKAQEFLKGVGIDLERAIGETEFAKSVRARLGGIEGAVQEIGKSTPRLLQEFSKGLLGQIKESLQQANPAAVLTAKEKESKPPPGEKTKEPVAGQGSLEDKMGRVENALAQMVGAVAAIGPALDRFAERIAGGPANPSADAEPVEAGEGGQAPTGGMHAVYQGYMDRINQFMKLAKQTGEGEQAAAPEASALIDSLKLVNELRKGTLEELKTFGNFFKDVIQGFSPVQPQAAKIEPEVKASPAPGEEVVEPTPEPKHGAGHEG